MYFVPVRKLSKVLLVRRVSPVQESHRTNFQRWLFLITAVLICLYIAFYHNTQVVFIRRRVPANYSNIDNRNKGHVVKKDSPKFDEENTEVDDILKYVDDNLIKEGNITPIATVTMTIVKNTKIEVENESYKNKRKGPMLHNVRDNGLPICESIIKQNGKEKQRNVKKRRTKDMLSEIQMGGYYYPKDCRSRHKVAILVPYRNRKRNLEIFMYHMHPFLIKQKLEYRIFVIEQDGNERFNRGRLLNIGFTEMLRTYNQYHVLFGGVTALSVQHYKQINGFSNLYWGWGGEDNDMYWRILFARMPMIRYHRSVAHYKSLPHEEQPKNNFRYQLLKFAVTRYQRDGLSNLVYKVIWIKHRPLYTHILADVNPLRENITNLYRKMFL
ncbi:beta-1,4-N-acetylgalactosaminyltransferase bre-4 isoform X3 [Manduca sexta]|uniref:beta-1,4-N-acetylgalactosaminyltransferase bre-4 isoform X3 n=1 Tax=Manduca sexta TaxID=7130 RepID=UPI00188E2A64|nr:beta-1,4-N-acetylgalactosaminyltransferase bre-4 isoform X3 [Manduca sexta]